MNVAENIIQVSLKNTELKGRDCRVNGESSCKVNISRGIFPGCSHNWNTELWGTFSEKGGSYQDWKY